MLLTATHNTAKSWVHTGI